MLKLFWITWYFSVQLVLWILLRSTSGPIINSRGQYSDIVYLFTSWVFRAKHQTVSSCQLREKLIISHTWELNSCGCATPPFFFFFWPTFSCQISLHLVFNFRSCRPSWQPRNCPRDWKSLWGATLLTKAPWLPTERFMMKEPSSPLRRTDTGGPAGETSVSLALMGRGFGTHD